MEITEPKIADYIANTTPPDDPVIEEMNTYMKEHKFPSLGPQVGRLLYLLVKMSGAKRIFEFGSGFGYSLYWMAIAAPDDAQLLGAEYERDNVHRANEFLRRGGFSDKAEVRCGEAFEVFKSLDGEFDIILSDAEKSQYPEIFRLAADRLKVGGLFLCDNVLWGGEVLDDYGDRSATAIKEFNELIFADTRFTSIIVPIRDGLSISLKEKA